MFTKGETWQRGRINERFGTDIYTLRYIKWRGNKDLLYSTGKLTPYCVISYMGKKSEKECIYVYV